MTPGSCRFTVVLLGGLLLAVPAWAGTPAAPADWPSWRGPQRTGISEEKGWTTQWPGGKPKELWKKDIGEGYSSIAVSGKFAVAMGNVNNTDTVWCLDAETGQELWKHAYPCGSDRGYPGPRATPAIDGNAVYTFSRLGHLFCINLQNGQVVWKKDARQELGARIPQWGLSGSPQVVGSLLILNVGAPGASVLAFDKSNGNVAWKGGQAGAGYSSAVPFPKEKPGFVALFTAAGLEGFNLQNGQQVFSHGWKTSYDVNSADPLIEGDKAFISSGYGTGCALVQIGAGGARELWRNKSMACHTSPPVLYQGHIYGFDGQMGRQTLKCLDFATGQEKWSEQRLGGTLIVVDGKLVILSDHGELIVAPAAPNAFQAGARAQVLNGTCWTTPAFAGGRLYARNKEGQAVAVDLRGK
ncbi:MAG: PQQ-like beta-propeller repeat protein [Planctomycetota bacterium]|nr:PQQ-like beta-propeller repeat protein [Planctomycetota bacterium]